MHSKYDDNSSNFDAESADKSTDEGSSSRVTGQTDDDVENIRSTLTQRETKQVFRLRVLVILILIAAAACISFTVYHIIRKSEKEEFEIQYYGVANKIIQSFQDIMVEISAVSGLAVAASTESANQEAEWPFITLANFQERAGNARALSGAIYVSINPIVQEDQLADWEKYVQGNNKYWINDGLEYQEIQGLNNYTDADQVSKSWITESRVVDPLHTFDKEGYPVLASKEGPFLPRWQTSPVLLTSMVNENLFEKDHVNDLARECISKKAAILGGQHLTPIH